MISVNECTQRGETRRASLLGRGSSRLILALLSRIEANGTQTRRSLDCPFELRNAVDDSVPAMVIDVSILHLPSKARQLGLNNSDDEEHASAG